MSTPDPLTLGQRLRQWIVDTAGEEVAEQFFPWVRTTLSTLGRDLQQPAHEETFRRTKAQLRRADITPARMQTATREARRAKEEGLSALGWVRSVQRRAHSAKLAEGAYRQAKERLKEEFDEDESDLRQPPTPTEAFAFLLAWEELGGSSGLAALRELQQRDHGVPAQN